MSNNLITPMDVKAKNYLNEIKQLAINNATMFQMASDMLKEVVSYTKTLEAQQKERTSVFKKEIDLIKEEYSIPLKFLKEADATLRSKLNSYAEAEHKRQLEIQQAEKEKFEEEQLNKALELEKEKEGAKQYDKATQNAVADVINEKQEKLLNEAIKKGVDVKLSTDNMNVRKLWTFEVEDITQVPKEFLTIDTKAVNEAIKNGARNIAGLKIFQKMSVAVK